MDTDTDAVAALDHEACHRVVTSRDPRFDGVFFTAVRTTGIYCRPSCPARTPASGNVTFHRSAASAQAAGFRACKRCAPDAVPGSPEWDVAADVADRAMRLVADGVVDRDGVDGLATRLGYSHRHLTRLLVERWGVGPLALARARRARAARELVVSSPMAFADVAFAAGFSSVRQFNATMQEIYALTPQQMRGEAQGESPGAPGEIAVRLAVRTPFAGRELLAFLRTRAVAGVEWADERRYARTLRLPRGGGTVVLEVPERLSTGQRGHVLARFRLADLRDLSAATERTRRLLDADCDPVAVGGVLGADPLLAGLVARTPGLRVPGHVDGAEVATRAVLGQQVSVAAARTLASRLVQAAGERFDSGVEGLTHLFPSAEAVAGLDVEHFAGPRARARALTGLMAAVADGSVDLSGASDRDAVRASMLALPGIGPWTADYVAMRALGHPDVLLPTDTGTRDGLLRLAADPRRAAELGERWRPWRSYAQMYLWHSLNPEEGQ